MTEDGVEGASRDKVLKSPGVLRCLDLSSKRGRVEGFNQ